MKKVLLYSGGMDSWLINKLWKPDILLYVDMSTSYSEQEIDKLRQGNESVVVIKFPLGCWERDDAIIPLRNMYLIMLACNFTQDEEVEVCVGATQGDRSIDQSKEFADKLQNLLNFLYQPQHWLPNGKKVIINYKYKDNTKAELLKMFIDSGGSMDEAFNYSLSCYKPVEGTECWNCKPCFRKFVAFAINNYSFDTSTIEKAIGYIRNNIQPQISTGKVYRSQKEDLEILQVIEKFKEY